MDLNKRKSISYAKFGYLFILPFFIVYLFFQVYPLFYTFYLSTQSNGAVTTDSVGFDNFKIIVGGQATSTPGHEIGDRAAKSAKKNFGRVLGNTCILWVGNFIPQIIISLLLAAWFTDAYLKIKGKGFYKIVMYMPNIITAASVAALFVMLFSDTEYGAVNNFLVKLGKERVKFVAGVNNEARIMIMIIQTWMWFGNTTIMLMSGIMGINPSLFEAANIDGATPTQQFFRITIPLLRPILLYTVVTSMIGGLQMFDIPYLYNAQAGAQNQTTETVACYIYRNFHSTLNPNFGYSAAASVVLFFITVALGAIAFVTNLEEDPRSAHAKNMKKNSLKKTLGGV